MIVLVLTIENKLGLDKQTGNCVTQLTECMFISSPFELINCYKLCKFSCG